MLFAAAFPLAPLVALLVLSIELREDAKKLLRARRPMPSVVDSIGAWAGVLEVVTVIAVVTNMGLICFTSDVLSNFAGDSTFATAADYGSAASTAAAASSQNNSSSSSSSSSGGAGDEISEYRAVLLRFIVFVVGEHLVLALRKVLCTARTVHTLRTVYAAHTVYAVHTISVYSANSAKQLYTVRLVGRAACQQSSL